MEDSYNKIFGDVEKVLVVVAHPDDMDILSAGTAARLTDEGKKIRVLVCTNGAMGSRENEIPEVELAKIRKQEQVDACKILGIVEEQVFVLNNKDCSFSPWDNELIEPIVYHIRDFQPQIVITHDFETIIKKRTGGGHAINHRDHRAVGGAVVNALMPMSRDISFFPQHKMQGLDGFKVDKLLIGDMHDGDIYIDVNDGIERKVDALLSHKSQFDQDTVDRVLWYHDANSDKDTDEKDYYERFRLFEMEY